MTTRSIAISLLCLIGVIGCAPDDRVKPGPKPDDPNQLLSAFVGGGKYVDKVEVYKVDLAPNQKTPEHTNSVPVAGYVVSGKLLFQVGNEPQQTLTAGQSFFEPANTKIKHFDAVDGPTQCIRCYLLGNKDRELIKK